MTTPAPERVCRFHRRGDAGQPRIAAVLDDTVFDLSVAGTTSLAAGDRVTITIDGIGTPDNTVVTV